MRVVKEIPKRNGNSPGGPRDPWFDIMFDGQLWEIPPTDWKKRYPNIENACNSIRSAAKIRQIIEPTISRRDGVIYVQARSK